MSSGVKNPSFNFPIVALPIFVFSPSTHLMKLQTALIDDIDQSWQCGGSWGREKPEKREGEKDEGDICTRDKKCGTRKRKTKKAPP